MTSRDSSASPAHAGGETHAGGEIRRLGSSLALLVGVAIAALHIAFGPDILSTLGTLYDDVVYLSLGKALAGGEGYRSIHLVGSPVHVKFPPLLPFSYSIFWWLTGSLKGALYGAYALSMLMLAGGASALWGYGRRLGIRWWLIAFFALGPLLLVRTVRYFAGAVSEPWFLLGWAVALLLVDRLAARREGTSSGSSSGSSSSTASGSSSDRTALLLGLVLAATVLARTQAVVLIPAILGALLLHRLGARVIGIAAGAAVAPLAIWQWAHGRMMAAGPLSTSLDQSSYLDWIVGDSVSETLTLFWVAAKVNLPNYLLHASAILVGWSSWKAQAVVFIAVALAVLGTCLSARKRPELVLSVAAMTTVLVFWPFNQARFLTTLLPFAGLAAAFGVDRIVGSVPKLLQRATVVACAVLAVALGIRNEGTRRNTYAYQASEGSPPMAFRDATAWIETHTEREDHILADYSGVYFLRTGRQTSTGFPEQPFTLPSILIPPGRHLARQLLADSVDYVIDARPSEGRIGLQVQAVAELCPGVLEPRSPIPTGDAPTPRYYAVTRDEACLTDLANQVSPLERALNPTG